MKISDLLSGVGNPICYYPSLAKLIGVKETIFLCHICFWSGKGKDGWIYRTSNQVFDETGLSKKEQATVRENLSIAGLIEDKRGQNCFWVRPITEILNSIWESESPIDYDSIRKCRLVTSEDLFASDERGRQKCPLVTSEGGGTIYTYRRRQ